jgi:hypothetical protein
MITLTWSLFTSEDVTYVDDVAPVIFVLFNFHRYEGVAPPFTAVAVNDTDVPLHTGLNGFPVALTLAVRFGETVIVIGLDEPVAGEAQLALEVMTTVIISPVTNAEVA